MEGIDIACIVIAGELLDAVAHLVGGLIREGYAENMAGQDAEFIHEICESVRERSGLTGACACDNADVAFGAGNGV